jgi:calcineurin-like phosphoesterase family protein
MRQPKEWLITDTHFNHKLLEERGYRPAGFTGLILDNWRRLVHPEDTVYHLGDVIIGQNGTLGAILETVPGRKILVKGNHDHESNAWYLRKGFDFVAQGILHGGVWFSHIPAETLPSGALLNVHGHLHDDEHRGSNFPEHCKLLSLEQVNYEPVEFTDFVGFSPMRRLLIGE